MTNVRVNDPGESLDTAITCFGHGMNAQEPRPPRFSDPFATKPSTRGQLHVPDAPSLIPHLRTHNHYTSELWPPRGWLTRRPAAVRSHIARFRHLGRDGSRVALSIIDGLGRRSTADLIPSNVFRRELQVRIDVLQIDCAQGRHPGQAAPAGAQGLVERFGAGTLVPARARHGVVPYVGGRVAAGVGPVETPEVSALVAAKGLESVTVLWRGTCVMKTHGTDSGSKEIR